MILRAVTRCCFALLWLLAAAGGLALYAAALAPRARAWLSATFVEDGRPTLALQLLATALLILVLLVLWARVRRTPRPPDTLSFDTPDGHIEIAAATLGRFIKAIIRNDARVSHASVKTALDQRKINVHARITVDEHQPITALATALQQTVRQRVYEAFGFDLLRDIRIEVAGIVTRESRQRLLTWGRSEAADAERDTSSAHGADSA
jgi:uncharacterized alkaline shock family protein YloU